jgi:hypothetical protein
MTDSPDLFDLIRNGQVALDLPLKIPCPGCGSDLEVPGDMQSVVCGNCKKQLPVQQNSRTIHAAATSDIRASSKIDFGAATADWNRPGVKTVEILRRVSNLSLAADVRSFACGYCGRQWKFHLDAASLRLDPGTDTGGPEVGFELARKRVREDLKHPEAQRQEILAWSAASGNNSPQTTWSLVLFFGIFVGFLSFAVASQSRGVAIVVAVVGVSAVFMFARRSRRRGNQEVEGAGRIARSFINADISKAKDELQAATSNAANLFQDRSRLE